MVLPYLNCPMYNYSVCGLLLLDSHLVAIYFFVCSQQLVVSGCYFYYYLFDNQQWLCTKVEGAGNLPLGQFTAEMGNCFRHNKYVYILYLRHEDAILTILCTGLPITNAGQW